jgi:uncharacterized protein YukE
MSQAVVDPAEMRRFAQSLKRFGDEVGTQMGSLRGQFQGLSQTWRDKEHEKFAEEFDLTIQAIARFLEVSNQHIPFLLRKADRIDEYLQQR